MTPTRKDARGAGDELRCPVCNEPPSIIFLGQGLVSIECMARSELTGLIHRVAVDGKNRKQAETRWRALGQPRNTAKKRAKRLEGRGRKGRR